MLRTSFLPAHNLTHISPSQRGATQNTTHLPMAVRACDVLIQSQPRIFLMAPRYLQALTVLPKAKHKYCSEIGSVPFVKLK